MPEIEILPDPERLIERAAARCLQLIDEKLQSSNRFTLALSGGSTPRAFYARLAQARAEWGRVHFFWGDERCVPPSSRASNYHLARETLLQNLQVPPENIHRIRGELDPVEAAQAYEADLLNFFGHKFPRFDLILLGLGEDGHTASLFPGSPGIREADHLAVAVRHSSPPPPVVDRVSLTLPVLNMASNVLFLVTGASKARILAEVVQGPPRAELLPAQAVHPHDGRLLWLVDAAAATRLRSGG